MTGLNRTERVLYETPAALEGSTEASPEAMREAMTDDVGRLLELYGESVDLVAIQGQVSSMKSWLLTCTAEEFLDRAYRVVALAPQRVNRRSLAERLDLFGIPYLERPSRLDLCEWEPWIEAVGRVDERTCSTNGCPLYPDDQDLEELAEQALQIHQLETGGPIQLDQQAVSDLAARLDAQVCPHYLLEAITEIIPDDKAVQIATYAKVFKSASAGDQLAADVTLLDESHAVAADISLSTTAVDLPSITAALTDIYKLLKECADKHAIELGHDLEPIEWALEDWKKAAQEQFVDPEELFDENTITATSVFDSLHRSDEFITEQLGRAVRSGRRKRSHQFNKAHRQLRKVTEFFSRVQAHHEGDLDFIHTRYEARGEVVNGMAFRRVDGRNAGCTPREIYEKWCEDGTHSAIEKRWGDLLDHYIEAVWTGRHIVPGGDRIVPGATPLPLAELRSTTRAETSIGYSATHNELSDPARSASNPRRTAHRVVTAPLQLRSDGDDRVDYHGKTSVDASTPWFQDLVQQAKTETDARIAAVPINGSNTEKWMEMPVEELELPNGQGGVQSQSGIVPHSRAAIGDKGLEDLSIDTVLCGIQVQSPADTARRLVELWGMLASSHSDPAAALETSWRLLAQHAVSGTIQAAGRFRTSATNIVFERPELIELAGFKYETLSPSMEGFAGAFARSFKETKARYERSRDTAQAVRIVRYLEDTPSKSPIQKQFCSKYGEVHNATTEEATRAFKAAAEAGRVKFTGGVLRTTDSDESGAELGG